MTRDKVTQKYAEAAIHLGRGLSLMQEILDAMQSYADDRSEKWEESDSGEQYIEVKDEIDNHVSYVRDAENFEPTFGF